MKIHAAYINIGSEKLDQYGARQTYKYEVGCEDPFTSGDLYFEDAALTERFKKEYNEYVHPK